MYLIRTITDRLCGDKIFRLINQKTTSMKKLIFILSLFLFIACSKSLRVMMGSIPCFRYVKLLVESFSVLEDQIEVLNWTTWMQV
ncbi:hypothetical protein CS542_04290 [Pedobacter sp. IW39]|nr:hypothetical protein CS542_04290 [Pedobacter sp. IW39]